MAVIEFSVSDDLARKITGAFNSGRRVKLTFHVESRRVVLVECGDVWENAMAQRTFIPGASGVSLLTNGSVAR